MTTEDARLQSSDACGLIRARIADLKLDQERLAGELGLVKQELRRHTVALTALSGEPTSKTVTNAVLTEALGELLRDEPDRTIAEKVATEQLRSKLRSAGYKLTGFQVRWRAVLASGGEFVRERGKVRFADLSGGGGVNGVASS